MTQNATASAALAGTTRLSDTAGQLYYQRAGEGVPLVLLHASASSGGQWRGFVHALGGGFATYTPDLAGYGLSRPPGVTERWSLWDEARFLAPLIHQAREGVHLFGHSFGGAVALAAACLWPEHIRSVVVYEPVLFSLLRTGTPEDRGVLLEVARLAREVRSLARHGLPDQAMRQFVDYWNGSGAWERMTAGERWELSRVAGKVSADFQTVVAASLQPEQLSRLQCPVLILSGGRSPTVTTRIADLLAEFMPHARRVTLRQLGHMAPVTHPAATAEHVRDALISAHVPSTKAITTAQEAAESPRQLLRPVAAPALADICASNPVCASDPTCAAAVTAARSLELLG
jgi:lipase